MILQVMEVQTRDDLPTGLLQHAEQAYPTLWVSLLPLVEACELLVLQNAGGDAPQTRAPGYAAWCRLVLALRRRTNAPVKQKTEIVPTILP